MTRTPNTIQQIHRLLKGRHEAPLHLHETSKSWIFLGNERVYKLKKHVRDDLQDLTSTTARLHNCLTEVDLNRRLAPDVYIGVVRVVRRPDGQLALVESGETVDWLIEMRRLPANLMLDVLAVKHLPGNPDLRHSITTITDHLSAFYATRPVSNLNVTELTVIVLEQFEKCISVLRHQMFEEHHAKFETVLENLKATFFRHFDLFEARVAQGWVRECHGDLRPEHICLTEPPVFFDCLEFNRNLRLVDPFSEVAALGLECEILGAGWIKVALIEGLKSGLSNSPDPRLLNLYEAMHAAMRTRICLAHLLVPSPRKPEKWLPLALRYFEQVERCLATPRDMVR